MAVCDNHYLPQWVGAGHDHLRHLKMRQVKPKKKRQYEKSSATVPSKERTRLIFPVVNIGQTAERTYFHLCSASYET